MDFRIFIFMRILTTELEKSEDMALSISNQQHSSTPNAPGGMHGPTAPIGGPATPAPTPGEYNLVLTAGVYTCSNQLQLRYEWWVRQANKEKDQKGSGEPNSNVHIPMLSALSTESSPRALWVDLYIQ
ncbi:hypothetical protein STEG23_011747, partial [Scotinomys teguina]